MRQQKFSDDDLIEYHKDGFSDRAIARTHHCSKSAVAHRRYKLGLIANYSPLGGEKLTKKEMEKRCEMFNKLAKLRLKKFANDDPERFRKLKKQYYLKYRIGKTRKKIIEALTELKEDVEQLENQYPKDIFLWDSKKDLNITIGRFNEHCYNTVLNSRRKIISIINKKLETLKE